jgi:hypothetical protein
MKKNMKKTPSAVLIIRLKNITRKFANMWLNIKKSSMIKINARLERMA